MAVKRKATTALGGPKKQPRAIPGAIDLTHGRSVRDQTEEYRLGTAIFRVADLTPKWLTGHNRDLDEKHVSDLCTVFERQQLRRESVGNRLRVLCTKAEFERMRASLEQAGEPTIETSSSWPWFRDWVKVNGHPAELMAGQHRVAALQALQKEGRLGASSDPDALWWVCDIYNRDTLPPKQLLQLRANRPDHTLPDSAGQVWMQLVEYKRRNSEAFEGPDALSEMIRVADVTERRMFTLWGNDKWKVMITAWCSTRVGRQLFSVCLWAELSRQRVEDYWFDPLKLVLKRLSELCPNRPEAIQPEDWTALKGLPSLSAVTERFYPGAPLDSTLDDEAKCPQYRSPKLLTALTHSEYYAAYKATLSAMKVPDAFPDIAAILSRGRKEGRILSQVMSQIVQWINPKPTVVTYRQKSKPPHWEDFIPALEATVPEEAERAAQQLQRDIFEVVRGRWDELEGILGGDINQLAYVARFSHPIWHDLLVLVRQAVGQRFIGCMARYNDELPPLPSSNPQPTLIQDFDEAIRRLLQASRNPALQTPAAITQLIGRLSPLIAEWAVDCCDQALKAQANPRTTQWSASVLKQVQEERLAIGRLIQGPSVPTQPHASPVDGVGPNRATGVVERNTPIEVSPEPSLVVPPPLQCPAKPAITKPVPSSDAISSLLIPDAETIAAVRKVVRSRPRQQKFSPPVASRRRPPATPSQIHPPATTMKDRPPATTTTRPALPWTSGPVARPYRQIS